MKTSRMLMTSVATILTLLVAVTACEQEKDLLSTGYQPTTPLAFDESISSSISNGFLKDKLFSQAYEAYAGLHHVEISIENVQVIDREDLFAWVKANEKNKHAEINQKNRSTLAATENISALLVQAPAGSPFKQSVFIAGAPTSIIITDIRDVTLDFRFEVVQEGIGFYGDGYLDPWGNHSCDCVEESKIILKGTSYLQCGRCPDENDFPDPTF